MLLVPSENYLEEGEHPSNFCVTRIYFIKVQLQEEIEGFI